MQNKFSIIVPVYNAENYIKDCIESILNQDYENIELILINDGSRDNSLAICNNYITDKRVKIISQENRGVSYTRNVGIQNSTGEYIVFVDSDDCIESNMCSTYNNILNKHDVDLIISDFKKISPEKNIFQEKNFEFKYKEDIYNIDSLSNIFSLGYQYGMFNVPFSKCFKKSKIKSYFNDKISIGEDLLFCLNYIANIDHFYISNMSLYNYVIQENNNSLSTKYDYDYFKMIFEVYNETNHIIDKIGGSKTSDMKYVVHQKFIYDMLTLCERLSRIKNISFIDKQQNLNEVLLVYSNFIFKKDNYGINSWKWKIYYNLLSRKKVKSFILFSNFIKRRI